MDDVVISNLQSSNAVLVYDQIMAPPNIEFRWLIKENGAITDRELQYRFATKVTFECNSNDTTDIEWCEWKTVPTVKVD